MEASANRIGLVVDRVILACYHSDPATGKYVPVAINTMRVGAILVLLALGACLGPL